MNKYFIFKALAIVATACCLMVSCDTDYNEIDSDIIGDDHFDFLPYDLATVRAYNQPTGKVQSNNLAINALGIYNNPVFGKTRANFVTELQMDSDNKAFDSELFVSLDSVVLTVPYFSRRVAIASGGSGTYELDSIKGTGKIDLKVYESGYVLNDLDPNDNFETRQKYYSDEDFNFNTYKRGVGPNGTSIPNGTPLNNGPATENTEFLPSNKEFVILKVDKGLEEVEPKAAESRLAPRMRLHLDKAFFQKKIFEAPEGKLANNSVFREYFKGIYFQVADAADGTLMQLDFSNVQANITLYYKEYTSLVDEDNNPATPRTPSKWPEDDALYPGEERLSAREYVLNFAGNRVNLLDYQPSTTFTNGISNPNRTEGDSRLFIKGGEGSVAVIDLFGPDNFGVDGLTGAPDGVADELNIIRNQGWLINEANLTFYIDKESMAGAPEPQRLYLYDLDNNSALRDLFDDISTVTGFPKFDRFVHDGLLQREEVNNGRGVKYRIRITRHIRNLVRNDSTNVRLGLGVTESIGTISSAALKTPFVIPGAFNGSEPFTFDRVPTSSVMNPLGTILYGNNVPQEDFEKRLKLEIYYTKPN